MLSVFEVTSHCVLIITRRVNIPFVTLVDMPTLSTTLAHLREVVMTSFVTTDVVELIVHKQTDLLTNTVRYLVLLKTDQVGGLPYSQPQLVWMPPRYDLQHFIAVFEENNHHNQLLSGEK